MLGYKWGTKTYLAHNSGYLGLTMRVTCLKTTIEQLRERNGMYDPMATGSHKAFKTTKDTSKVTDIIFDKKLTFWQISHRPTDEF